MSGAYACFPACQQCREAGMCVQMIPAEDERAPRQTYPNQARLFYLTCGCLIELIPVVDRFNPKRFMCGTHGWQTEQSERRQTREYPDEPPF